jgi:Methyltransferase domain
MNPSLAERLKYSPLGRVATLPLRLRAALHPLTQQALQTLRWLPRSREWVNFSYDYEPEGLQAVVCAVSVLTGRTPAELRGFAAELHQDAAFAARYHDRVTRSRLRHTCDPELRFGRCLVNYLLVRASGARMIVEAGTDRGLSTWAMVRAVQRNGDGPHNARIVTVDIRGDRGEFLEGDEGGLVERHVGDSVALLERIDTPIELFLHDTVNEPVHSRAQFAALGPRLAQKALVHSCWFSDAFAVFCEQRGLRALEYVERPRDHWYMGRRCGLAALG